MVDQQIASLTKAKQSKTRPIKASELNASQSIASELKTRLSKSQSVKSQSVNCQNSQKPDRIKFNLKISINLGSNKNNSMYLMY